MLSLRRKGRVPAAMAASIAVLASAAAAFAASPGPALPEQARLPAAPGEEPIPTGRLLVKLDREGMAPIRELLRRTDVVAPGRAPLSALVAVDPGTGEGRAALRERLLADPAVERVSTEHYFQLRSIPNDPAYSAADPNAPGNDTAQWNLRRQNFEQAWDLSSGADAKVAIVDTGITDTSPDLGHVLPGDDNDLSPSGARSDERGHGSHVAGLACADSGNGHGGASAGYDCSLIPEKVEVVGGENLTELSVIEGINNAAARDADVINLSLGGAGQSSDMKEAIYNAWASGSVIVASAENPTYVGNQLIPAGTDQGYPAKYVVPQGSGSNPATCPDGDATSVGCSRGLVVTMAQYDDKNAGSGTGSGISIAAYGDSLAPKPGIFSTFPATATTLETMGPDGPICPPLDPADQCRPRADFAGDKRFAYLFGTSMAAPQVSGLAALIRSANPSAGPGLVVRAIRETASGCGQWNPQLGFGIIDAGRAVASATGRDTSAPVSKAAGPKKSKRRRFTVQIQGSDTAAACGGLASGVDNISVVVAEGKKGRFKLLEKTSRPTVTFKGKRGRKYSFYTRAQDKSGNQESDRGTADVTVKIKKKRMKSRKR